MMKVIKQIFGIIVSLAILMNILPLLLWYLPLIISFIIIKRKKDKFPNFIFTLSIGGILTGLWSYILVRFILPLSSPFSEFAYMPISNSPELRSYGRYIIGGLDWGEFATYIGLVTICGFILLLIFGGMKLISFIKSLTIRVWLFRVYIILSLTGGTYIVYLIASDYAVPFGFFAYMIGIGFLIEKTDPKEELDS